VGIKELVELKKTQRIDDYPVISRLVLAHLALVAPSDLERDLPWAIDNTFSLPELYTLLREHFAPIAAMSGLPEPLMRLLQTFEQGQISSELEDEIDALLEARAAALRAADRRYWKGIIDELRALRQGGKLMAENEPV
jgi:hypothetical protein